MSRRHLDADLRRQTLEDWPAQKLTPALLEDVLAIQRDTLELWLAAATEEPLVQVLPAALRGADGGVFDVVAIAQQDAPHLMDTIEDVLADRLAAPAALLHPAVTVAGRRTSVVVGLFEAGSPMRLDAFVADLRATLAQFHTALGARDRVFGLIDEMARRLAGATTAGSARGVEYVEFSEWLKEGRFTPLGARWRQGEDGLEAGVVFETSQADSGAPDCPVVIEQFWGGHRERLRRRAPLDVMTFRCAGAQGPPCELQVFGFFTTEAMRDPVQEIPLIRRKIDRVLRRGGMEPGSHNHRKLKRILEEHPRQDVFECDAETLYDTAAAILRLQMSPRVKLFWRSAASRSYATAVLLAPRDRYMSDLRQEAGRLLADAAGGRVAAFQPYFSDSPLARVRFVLAVPEGSTVVEPDLARIEGAIAELALTWQERFDDARARGGAQAAPGRWSFAFPETYRAVHGPDRALADLPDLVRAAQDDGPAARATVDDGGSAFARGVIVYRRGAPPELAETLSILGRMGLHVVADRLFGVDVGQDGAEPCRVWVQEFGLAPIDGAAFPPRLDWGHVTETLLAVWTGQTENDGFNRLVLELSIPWRDAALIRTLARYRQQSG
ncbi:MAG: hypothetical protein ACK4F1_13725, partial [Phenylobacterium sp.]